MITRQLMGVSAGSAVMYRIVILIMLFMIAVFTLVTNLAARHSGQPGFNPFEEAGRFISNSLRGADRIAPELTTAIGRVEVSLPRIVGAHEAGERPAFVARDLSDADFTGQNHVRKNFAAVIAERAVFANALLDGATFEGASADEVVMRRAQLGGATLNAALLRRADFTEASLRGANMRGSDATGARFAGADISFASLSGASADGADFTGAYAAGAKFNDARLAGAVFSSSTLTGARFAGANLSNTRFTAAKLDGAAFTGANIRGADFSGALGVAPEQFASTCADARTRLPHGVSAPIC